MIDSATVEKAIDGILSREGGFVDRKDDAGGPTNFGVTAATLGSWRKLGRAATRAEVLTMGVTEARSIYRRDYIEAPGFLAIDHVALFNLVIDSAVNHGQGKAVELLQEAMGCLVDGDFGPKTRSVLAASCQRHVARGFFSARLRFYGRIVSKNLTDADKDGVTDAAENASGWLNRLSTFTPGDCCE